MRAAERFATDILMVWLDSQLAEAVAADDLRCAVKLLRQGAEADEARDQQKTPAVVLAAKLDHARLLQLLLTKGASTEVSDGEGDTALTVAARLGHEGKVGLLLRHGANANQRDLDDRTPLIIAAEHGQTSIVGLLLSKRAHPDLQDITGRTALHQICADAACCTEHDPTIPTCCMCVAIFRAHAALDLQNTNGDTGLILAAQAGHSHLVKELLAKGALPDLQNANGETALILAAKAGHSQAAMYLIQAGAAVDLASNAPGRPTALFFTARCGHSDIAKMLLDAGATTEGLDENGFTLLYQASCRYAENIGCREISRVLLERGLVLRSWPSASR